MEKKNINLASLFGNNLDIGLDERARVAKELKKIGSLNFDVSKSKDGWMAQCKELPGIITGDTNPNPENDEIESQIRDAIYVAFNVKIQKKTILSDYQKFKYSFNNN